jgi:hypothetical protein
MSIVDARHGELVSQVNSDEAVSFNESLHIFRATDVRENASLETMKADTHGDTTVVRFGRLRGTGRLDIPG